MDRMTHHDGTEHTDVGHADALNADAGHTEQTGAAARDVTVDEAADYVHPVDHDAGTKTDPLESEEAGSYVSGTGPDIDDVGTEEKGDYVDPVDHGAGSGHEPIEDAGDYVSPTNQPPER